MNKHGAANFLVEIGTEELPPKALLPMSEAFRDGIAAGIKARGLACGEVRAFATPRRLAVLAENLQLQAAVQHVEVLGPPAAKAKDEQGRWTPAATGFARKQGAAPEDLLIIEAGPKKERRLAYRNTVPGIRAVDCLPGIVAESARELPIPKRMRWGAGQVEFARPVHWVVMLLGGEVVDCELLGRRAGRLTRGHRFHSGKALKVPSPEKYEALLEKAYVIADFNRRRERVRSLVERQAQAIGADAARAVGDRLPARTPASRRAEQTVGAGHSAKRSDGAGQTVDAGQTATGAARAVIGTDLLDEVTALVEWPAALTGAFAEDFLQLPPEVLISVMREHQKYFHVVNAAGELLPRFITVANIESSDAAQVIDGNERVIRPRLADADFFFTQDRQQTLESRLPQLERVVFQQKLGSLGDKTRRLVKLCEQLAPALGAIAKPSRRADAKATSAADPRLASRADAESTPGANAELPRNADTEPTAASPQLARRVAELSKADLVTLLVGEFAGLQGIAGRYYALNDGEAPEVAAALEQQYRPRFAGDSLPDNPAAACLALADRLDTLAGIFGIGQAPSGSRDPFSLRRAALGVLRILVEGEYALDLADCLDWAVSNYPADSLQADAKQQVLDYMIERFRAWYEDASIPVEVFRAVKAVGITAPLDFHRRVQAVHAFTRLPEAPALAEANKRVSNILNKWAEDQGQPGKPAAQSAQQSAAEPFGATGGVLSSAVFKFAEEHLPDLQEGLLQDPAEQSLALALREREAEAAALIQSARYTEALRALAALQPAVSKFFDDVLVMAEDNRLRQNRLRLLHNLRRLFLQIADISELVVK